MNPVKHIYRMALAAVACMSVLSGCVREYGPVVPDDSRDVVFSINVPGNPAAGTRALGEGEESEVQTIEMLLFDPATHAVAGNPVFANNVSTDQDDFRKKTFTVRLPSGGPYDVMIFANARKVFNAAGMIAPGDGQEATLAKLKVSMPEAGWATAPADADKKYLIPMWGMKKGLAVGQGTSISGVWLHRMLARIDLSVTGTDSQTGNFELIDIKLHNAQKQGRIAPLATNWNAAGKINGTVQAGLATAPSLVAGCDTHLPISYAPAIVDGKSCTGEMYLFEAPKAAAHADRSAPFLTVKGKFNNVEGWYRVDLADYSDMSYLDVLRNHLYKIQIAKVSGTGFFDEDDAIANRGDNIKVDITMWNEYDLGGTVFDGQHYLSINPQEMEFSVYGNASASLTIKTDVDSDDLSLGNIKVSGSPSDPDAPLAGGWINNPSLSIKSVVNGKNVYTLTFGATKNDSGNRRTGYIYVKCGHLTNVVRIDQQSIDLATVVGLAVDGAKEVPSGGGESGLIGLTGVPAELAGSLTQRVSLATVSGISSDGRSLVRHAATLEDENGNAVNPDQSYPVSTKFRVRFPKLYYPNREISGTGLVTVTLSDGTAKVCTVNQMPLTARPMKAWNNAWGNYYGSIILASYNGYLLTTLGTIPGYTVDGSLNNHATAVPANTTYLHMSLNGTFTVANPNFTWTTANTWRASNDGLLVVSADENGSQNIINHSTSPIKAAGYPDVGFDGTALNTGRIRVTDTKVYQFIMQYARNRLVPANVTTNFHGDDVHTSMPIAGLPSSAVVLVEFAASGTSTHASIVIDPERNLMYMGECQHFQADAISGNRSLFLQNLVKYMQYAAEYGTAFTCLMIEDGRPNALPAPWDAYWGANKITPIP